MRTTLLTLTLLLPRTVAAADDDALRQRALKLNEVGGDKAIEAQINTLAADADGTRKLFAVAAKMAK